MITRTYRDDVQLSILGFGGMVVVGHEQEKVNKIVSEAIAAGINYFDVAPIYGNGEAEIKLGPALLPFRKDIFLACKTIERSAEGARREFEQSLIRLKTNFFDLYQLHSVNTMADVEILLAPGGALEVIREYQRQGRIRYIGFSSHNENTALALMDAFAFDSVLFPTNFVCVAHSGFSLKVHERARAKGVARLALKAMARRSYQDNDDHTYPNCWYVPIDELELARQALRYTLSLGVSAMIPPGDIRLFRLAVQLVNEIQEPLTKSEQAALFYMAKSWTPIFPMD